MNVRHHIIATAGHIDHGKSALVKALTGTDPDRLPEEKRRGITIDLGFAELALTTPDGKTIHAGIVDVPGHEGFVRNMIAGFGSVDLALLVVAADDGWMPQTEEHFQILSYLGVSRLVVAITKCDAADGESATADVRNQLQGSAFAKAAIVQTSVTGGKGLDELKAALARTLMDAHPPADYAKARLPIDRVFTLRGIGTVVTGTLIGGFLKAGEPVWVQPSGIPTRIRSLQSHDRDVTVAAPGMRTALNLPEVEAGDSPRATRRGDVILNHSADASKTIDVLLQVSGRAAEISVLKTDTRVDVHHGTARIRAVLKLLEQDSLSRGETALAQLRLERPIVAFYQDRLVVRNTSQNQTLAGGIILDPDASRRRELRNRQGIFLRARARQPGDIRVAIVTQLQRDQFVARENLLSKSSFTTDQISKELQKLAEKNEIVLVDSLAADVSVWSALRDRAIQLIDQAHARNPQDPGLDLAVLRRELRTDSAAVTSAVITSLVASPDFTRKDETIARRDHRAELPPALQAAAAEILRRLAENPFDPPTAKTIALDEKTRKAMRFLADSGQVIEIDSNVVLTATAFERMKDVITQFLRTKPAGASASEIRLQLQTSRRIVIPLLEYLDRKNLTRRRGDLRILAH